MPTYAHEFRALLALALPSALSNYCFFAISVTELSIIGHLGVDQLAAVAYSQMSMDFSTLVFMQGFNAGMNALCSQAFGAKNYHLLGQYGQLTATMLTVMCVPTALLWWNLGELLLLVGVQSHIAAYASVYCRLWILGMWPRSMFQVLLIFYQSQQIVLPTAAINGATVVFNYVLAAGLTHGRFGLPELGFIGCPIGTAIALWLRLVVYYYYMHVYKQYDRKCRWAWAPQSIDRSTLTTLVSVGFPLAAGNLFEDAQLQVMALFSATIGKVQLGTHNSMMEFFLFATSPIYGLMDAAVTRSGAHLGAGNGHLALMVAQITALCIAALSVVNGSIMVFLNGQIARIFSDDAAVIDSFRQLGALGAIAYTMLAFFYWSMIVLESQARPLPIMIGFALGAWLVGVPSAYFLGLYHGRHSFVGIWIGMLLGYAVTASIGFSAAFFGTDWDLQAHLAVERSREKKLLGGPPSDHHELTESDPLLP